MSQFGMLAIFFLFFLDDDVKKISFRRFFELAI